MAIHRSPATPSLLTTLAVSLAVVATWPARTDAQQGTASPSPAAKHITILDDVAYRSGASPAWRLDLAMPDDFGGELRPALIIVHGGGWSAGSKRDRPYRSMLLDFALEGYVTLSIDYRLRDEAPFPAAMEDVDCAVRWLRAHADEYGVDPERIGAWGHSAGAHLAVMLAASPPAPPVDSDCEWSGYSSRITSVAAGSTPTVLPDRFGDSERYSPATWVSSSMPPLLLIQGTEDTIVPVASVDEYVERLQEAGAPDVTYLRIDGGNHGVAYEHFLDRSMEAITRFFQRTLQPGQDPKSETLR